METFEQLPAHSQEAEGPHTKPGEGVALTTRQIWAWACIIGIVGGLTALGYYALMRGALYLVWDAGAKMDWTHPQFYAAFRPIVLLVTTLGGFVVGLVLHFMGTPGEIAAVVNNIHMEQGRIDPKQTPSMIAASLASIVAGGSAGPEAPLVQIVGSFGSWVSDRLRLRGDLVRTLTFCGMGAALGAFFGAPLGGALFALEIPHRRGLEYYEALMPSILAAIVAFVVFRLFAGYDGAIYHLTTLNHFTVMTVLAGLGAGLAGGVLGTCFILLFQGIEKILHPLARYKILLATLGGLMIGGIAQLSPATLFWSEYQIQGLVTSGSSLVHAGGLSAAIGMLLLLALLKMVAVGATLHSGFRGGFIFPLFFIGGAVGLAISLALAPAFPNLPAPVIILCMMAATNVAVTKTPISTAVILTSLSGTSYLPALATASFASFLLTTRISLISTQRSRVSLRNPVLASSPSPAA